MMRYITWHLLFVLLPFIFIPFNSNNSCSSYLSYLFISFSSATHKCHHNPDINDNITNVIQRHTNSSETHQVQTEDGYVLDLFRIHRKNPRGVILFQHSFLFDARIWVNQNNDSVAFLFWKAGYDVWLGNSRGNFYAKKHVRLRPSDPEFWNYSLSELGYFDLNATIEYIKATTNQRKIIYVGYSLGGTTGLIYASMRPEDALNSLQIMITMASGTTFKNAYGMMRTAVPVSIMMQRFKEYTGVYSIAKYDIWYLKLWRIFHKIFPFKTYLPYMISFLYGWTPDEMDPNYANSMVSHFDSEYSLNILHHFVQLRLNGAFQAYDYGETENMKVYGSNRPFLYPLEKIKVPTLMVFSYNHILSHYMDNELAYQRLSEEATVCGKLVVEGLNHVDYIYGRHRNEKVYNKILQLLNNL